MELTRRSLGLADCYSRRPPERRRCTSSLMRLRLRSLATRIPPRRTCPSQAVSPLSPPGTRLALWHHA